MSLCPWEKGDLPFSEWCTKASSMMTSASLALSEAVQTSEGASVGVWDILHTRKREGGKKKRKKEENFFWLFWRIMKSGCVRDSIKHFCRSVCQLGRVCLLLKTRSKQLMRTTPYYFFCFLPSETLLKIFSKIIIKHSRMDIFITKHKIWI